jgi:outer membrane protein OmpA-like peptidoglycan-associated protein
MKKIVLLLSFALFILGSALAQTKNIEFVKKNFPDSSKERFSEALKNYRKGDNEYFKGGEDNLVLAIPFYKDAHKFNPNCADLNFRLGSCLLASEEKFEALPYLEKAKAIFPMEYEEMDFYLGQSLHLAYRFEEAIEKYKAFQSTSKVGSKDYAITSKKIQECRNGMKLIETPIRVWVDNLGPKINTDHAEYAPVISADDKVMFFTGRRPDGTSEDRDEFGKYFEDVFYVKNENREWVDATNIGAPINTADHNATVNLAADGRSILMYNGISKKEGKILISTVNEDGSWNEPVSIGDNINSEYHEESASLSFDEKTIYFTSDRPGGMGMHDIYVAEFDDATNTWGEPEMLDGVNTKYDERGVYFHPDGKTLYYSSSGHNTMGGLDIFKSELNEEGEWSKPMNIGYPINTPDDDIYFVVAGNQRTAYYSSYQKGGYGEKDIYKLTFLGDPKDPELASDDDLMAGIDDPMDDFLSNPDDNMEEANMAILSGTIRDAATQETLISDVKLIDNTTKDVVGQITTDKDGNYVFPIESGKDYALSVKKEGYIFYSENFSIEESEGFRKFTKNVDLNKISNVNTGDQFALNNIFYDFDKSTLRSASITELKNLIGLLKKNPTWKIQISSYTDTRGSSAYNNSLSRRRAKSVVNYLTKNGISKSNLKYKGYGESSPRVSDTQIEAMTTEADQENGHQQNRRTEFKLLRK